jgi:hypothetical protein
VQARRPEAEEPPEVKRRLRADDTRDARPEARLEAKPPGQAMLTIDKNSDWPIFSPVCTYCRHLTGSVPSRRQAVCAAFPRGIPEGIWLGRNKHQKPYPGDHGIQFEPHPDVVPEVLQREGLA